MICSAISRVVRSYLELMVAYPDSISTFSKKTLVLEHHLALDQPSIKIKLLLELHWKRIPLSLVERSREEEKRRRGLLG